MSEIKQNVDNKEPIKEEDQYEGRLTANPGDRISEEPQTIEEKAQQVAVDSWDIVGYQQVPTYFVVDNPDGSQEALHHVKDADKISDVIRQARVDEDGNRVWW
ncbi:hypothetical protein [Gloeothece verrucosa]|uniref:Uncharacterized protein n=1 Tax=Gloeothece verrucosa (strain PCC 7822) TaxID=497965 RepID=E0U9E1_GLOV7|nr:hypothetical protein [Gloeothece verrucosa]ADN12633.1 conserved hypothetical protein [Gloeothece verrucosa PCC 7822]